MHMVRTTSCTGVPCGYYRACHTLCTGAAIITKTIPLLLSGPICFSATIPFEKDSFYNPIAI